MRAITLAEANKIIDGTFASAEQRKAYALAAIVLDAGGRVKAFQKQDGASLMRFEIAYGKAFGALALNRSSRQVLQKANARSRRSCSRCSELVGRTAVPRRRRPAHPRRRRARSSARSASPAT